MTQRTIAIHPRQKPKRWPSKWTPGEHHRATGLAPPRWMVVVLVIIAMLVGWAATVEGCRRLVSHGLAPFVPLGLLLVLGPVARRLIEVDAEPARRVSIAAPAREVGALVVELEPAVIEPIDAGCRHSAEKMCRICQDVTGEVKHIPRLAGSFVTPSCSVVRWEVEDNVIGGAIVRIEGAHCAPVDIGFGINELRGMKAAIDAWFAAHPEVKP